MWNRLFDMENPLMRSLSAVCDLLVLNLLTLVCCLPIITAGAAVTALCDLSLRMVRGEEAHIVKPYFRSLRANLKKGTLLGLLLLFAAAVFYVDDRLAAAAFPPLRLAVVAAALLVAALSLYAFPLLARYENTLPKTLQNAAALAVAFFPRTLGMLVFTVGLWLACLTFYQTALPVLLLFGLSLPAYVNALLLDTVFRRIDHEETEDDSQ